MRHVEQAWAGIDAGKGHHHVVVLDRDGTRVLSRRVVNTEPELIALIDSVITAADELTWAIDLADGPAALLIALLMHREQHLVYLPGIAVNRATAGYRGEGKTDARDAAIIADQARMRRDLRPLRPADPLVLELRMLTTHRADLATDRTRAINRLRGRLVAICPELEAVLDFTCHGPLMLIAEFPTAAAIRAVGRDELHRRLRAHKVRNAAALATRAHAAAGQRMRVPGEDVAAPQITRLGPHRARPQRRTRRARRPHRRPVPRTQHAPVLGSMVGIGDLLGAQFLAATGGDMAAFASADHLAGYAGLAPAPRDSGRRTGNLHRPRRYSRQLQRVFYTSALISIQRCPASKAFYERKRAEGKRHRQAVLALARRRVNVLWAMLRDQQPYLDQPTRSTLAA